MSARLHLDQIAALHARGWSYSDLAAAYGTTRGAIAGLLFRRSLPPRAKSGRWSRIGEANTNARLTEDQVREIRARRSGGETLNSIARAFGIDPSAVRLITLGKRWAHVA